jgi:hypothetical protein
VDEKQTKSVLILLLLGVAVAGVWSVATLFDLDVYGSGWEVTTEIDSVTAQGTEYTSTSQPAIVSEWGAKRVHFDTSETTKDAYGNTLLADCSAMPDIIVTIGNPYHVSFTGSKWVQDTTNAPYKTITKSFDTDNDGVDDKTTSWHHHVFMFEIDITTDADVHEYGAWSYLEAKGSAGTVAKILAKILFDVSSWKLDVPDSVDESFVYQSGWAGIMSSTVYKATAYYISEEPASYTIDSYAQPGAPLNMWTEDDVRFYPKAGAIDSISGVPSAVIIGQYVELLGGYTWPFAGSISVYDVGLLTTIRVDVLTSETLVLQSGDQPTVTTRTGYEPGLDPIGDFLNGLANLIMSPFVGFLDWMNQNALNLFMGIIIIIVVIVVVIMLMLMIRAKLSGTAVKGIGIKNSLPLVRWRI